MNLLDTEFLREFVRACDDGWHLGWHESHGGNMSYRLTDEERAAVLSELDFSRPWIPLGVCAPELTGDILLLTGSGKCFRDIRFKPEVCLGMIEIGADGTAYRPVWGFDGNRGRPTSETPAHVMNLAVKKRVTNGRHRVIYHAHPANIISLSFVLPLSDEVFTRELWEMEPECAMTFPSGLGVIPWMVPGQKEIAEQSGKLMERYDVILWAQHGLFCSAETASDALGLMNTVEKAAEMLVKCLSMSPIRRQAASVQNFRDMADAFHLNLPERFLYEK